MTDERRHGQVEPSKAVLPQSQSGPTPDDQPRTGRLHNGEGPVVTMPEWADDPDAPSPEQFLDWFLAQSREAQLVIAEYHIECERIATGTQPTGTD